MKAIAFALLVLFTAAALGQTVPAEAQAKPAREQLQVPLRDQEAQVPHAPPRQRPLGMAPPGATVVSLGPDLPDLVKKQTAAITELSERIKVLDVRLEKLEAKSK
jgi:hypothetical protein